MVEARVRIRERLAEFVARHVEPHEAVKAVVVYGSVASGQAREDSDVDAYVFMDPLDTSLLPAEAIWKPADDSFRSIFSADPLRPDELQVDFARVSLREWADPEFAWPVPARAALRGAWIAFEREGVGIGRIIEAHIGMSRDERRTILDRALLDADGLLDDVENLVSSSPLEALDRLNAMWEAVLAATFAVNSAWLPYRGRALRGLAGLEWRGLLTDEHLPGLVTTGGQDRASVLRRADLLAAAHDEILKHLLLDPDYGDDPTFAAFLRAHDEPGRAWNMDDWNRHRP